MKKLLFALTLFSIMPLCAMEKEIKKEKRTEQEQKELDAKLLQLMDNFGAEDTELEWLEDIEALLRQGANPNARRLGYPYLFLTRNTYIIRILLDYGADMLQANDNGDTLFHCGGIEQIVWLFLHARERNINLKNIISQKNKRNNRTPLSMAEDDVQYAENAIRRTTQNISYVLDQLSLLFPINDYQDKLLILTDPNKHIPLLYPDMAKQFQEEQVEFRQKLMERELKKTGTQSIHQYLLNREIGRKR